MRRLLLQTLLLTLLLAGCSRDVRQTPLPSQAYVWQRAWTPEVSVAVIASKFEALHVLAAEFSLKNDKPKLTIITPDWRALGDSGRQVGAVLRVHASVGKGGWNEALTQEMQRLCTDTVSRFKAGGVPLSELQLDYDSAESRLADYARLLGALHTEVPLCITALPAWLRHDSARKLLPLSPGYVLQVHSLHLPKRGGLTGLMDMDETRTAVRRAVEIGVPFRVALPTYSCVVEFAEDGRVRDVHAEDMPAGLALSGRKYAVLDSDAYGLSALMAEWRAHASELMQAVIWYRLPVSGDRLNWPPGLLPRVAAGEKLKRGWTTSVRPAKEGHHEIVLKQEGDAPDDLPHEVSVSWQGGDAAGCDGLRGYAVQTHAAGRLVLWLGQPARFGRVKPGEQIVAGWLRLPDEAGAGITAKIFR
ncbi:DUF3142 domain-containing protein [Prosthecobacter sp.]|uniref:DUF3142 domain-containing protein n=1 Tax=Prosthecobacter sp. TaxID=1965333 RepID=UPI0024880CC4|nr:DUF3142 domain-containing protein [Prosthecobacter sp.]MDI1314135.1 DUF3142 domain-containing protein [Prosthecobacter sp.]